MSRTLIAAIGTVCGLLATTCSHSFAATTVDPVASAGSKVHPFGGINLATGGFANDRLPGRYGFDYLYPDATVGAPFADAGMNAVRLPVLWERLQPQAGGPIVEVELQRVDDMIRAMAAFPVVILDIHNFGAYHGKRLDSDPALGVAFGDLWKRLATHYAKSPQVAFGLMNEPNGMSARSARALDDIAVQAIRRAGATNLILVPGTQWSGAHSWTDGGDTSNAAAFADFSDPGKNFVYELHDYLDADASGTKPECVSPTIGGERLTKATAWLRAQHARAVLGEFGAGISPTCLQALDRMLDFMDAHADVWAGWTYWAGGLWWGDYFTGIQPDHGEVRPQMQILMKHIRRTP